MLPATPLRYGLQLLLQQLPCQDHRAHRVFGVAVRPDFFCPSACDWRASNDDLHPSTEALFLQCFHDSFLITHSRSKQCRYAYDILIEFSYLLSKLLARHINSEIVDLESMRR